MIYQLRKRHRYTWSILAVLLPLGFVLAFLTIPEQKMDSKNLGFGQPEALVDVVKRVEGRLINANIRKTANQPQVQLEIMVMHPIKSPAATVHLSDRPVESDADGQFIGQLGPKGVYRFNLDSVQSQYSSFYLLIYDPIKDQPIERISL